MSDLELLAEAEQLLTTLWKQLLAVKPWLDKPYPDLPESSPWINGAKANARQAHDLSIKIRKRLNTAPDAETALMSWGAEWGAG